MRRARYRPENTVHNFSRIGIEQIQNKRSLLEHATIGQYIYRIFRAITRALWKSGLNTCARQNCTNNKHLLKTMANDFVIDVLTNTVAL